jgi:hypothetical protein
LPDYFGQQLAIHVDTRPSLVVALPPATTPVGT